MKTTAAFVLLILALSVGAILQPIDYAPTPTVATAVVADTAHQGKTK